MIGILIITHGRLGEALIDSAAHVLGKPLERVQTLSVTTTDQPEPMHTRASVMVRALDRGHGVLVLSDICGGTPCNIATRLGIEGQVETVSGVNLPMLIRALTYRNLALPEVVEKALSGGHEGVIRLSRKAADATGRS